MTILSSLESAVPKSSKPAPHCSHVMGSYLTRQKLLVHAPPARVSRRSEGDRSTPRTPEIVSPRVSRQSVQAHRR